MANGRRSGRVARSPPKTGWREPARARDELLILPRGRLLRPAGKVYVPRADAVLSDGVVGSEVSVSEVEKTARVVGQQDVGMVVEESRGVLMSQVDGAVEGVEGVDAEAEEDVGAGADVQVENQVFDTVSEDSPFVPDTEDELDDEELLASEEHSSDDAPERPSVHVIATSRPMPASKHRANSLREGTETICPHPTDVTKAIVTYRYNTPTGGLYIQETEIPEVISTAAAAAAAAAANRPNSHSTTIFPDVESCKIPRTKKGSPWTPVPGTSNHEWTRPSTGTSTSSRTSPPSPPQPETWRLTLFFRLLHPTTHTHQATYTHPTLLTSPPSSLNPNSPSFHTTYNKWILQLGRRRDPTYTAQAVRVPWTPAERRALYEAINAFCAEQGVHRFGFAAGCGLHGRALGRMAERVNAVGVGVVEPVGKVCRGADAVRCQIASARGGGRPKNKEVWELLERAAGVRERVARGEVLEAKVLRPRFAIPLVRFPREVGGVTEADAEAEADAEEEAECAVLKSYGWKLKRKRECLGEESETESSSGLAGSSSALAESTSAPSEPAETDSERDGRGVRVSSGEEEQSGGSEQRGGEAIDSRPKKRARRTYL